MDLTTTTAEGPWLMLSTPWNPSVAMAVGDTQATVDRPVVSSQSCRALPWDFVQITAPSEPQFL